MFAEHASGSAPAAPMRPGGEMARRELHFVWLLDTSGSMTADGKIQALNVAIREAIPQLRSAARDNPGVDVLVRALTFSSGARWHVGTPTPLDALRWEDVGAGGHTDMGKGLALLAEAMRTPPMPERAVSPVFVLVTDGHHTDDFDAGLAALLAENWGRDAVRMAITIGRDVNLAALQKFIGNDQLRPVQAHNPEALVQQIRWVSRSGLESVSQIGNGPQLPPESHETANGGDEALDQW
jgi:uncharacterized protein YegL